MSEATKITDRYLNLMLTKGILALVFGIFILVWPLATFASIAVMLGIFILLIGIIGLFKGIFMLAESWSGVLLIIVGAFGILLGVFILSYPGLSLLTYLLFLAIWFIIHGLFEVFSDSTQYPGSKGWLVFSGILNILLGFLMFFRPIATGATLFWILGLYGIITGPILIVTALSFKSKMGGIKNIPSHP